ncbi:MAG: hypothetical protein H7831_02715 [Magnetococcus sp. WYHC-3]
MDIADPLSTPALDHPAAGKESTRKTLAWVALLASMLAVGAGGAVVVARAGLPTPPVPLLLDMAVVLAAFWSPFLLPEAWLDQDERRHGLGLLPLLVLIAPVTGIWLGPWGGWLYPVLALAGLVRGHRALRSVGLAGLLWATLLAVLFAVAMVFFLHIIPYENLYTPEFAVIGPRGWSDGVWMSPDVWQHMGISSMILASGWPSTGVDGFVPLHYHAGSHYLYAGLMAMNGAAAPFSQPFAFLVLLSPACVAALALASLLVSSQTTAPWRILLWLFPLWLLVSILGRPSHYTTSSTQFSLTLALLALPALLRLLRHAWTSSLPTWAWLLVPPLLAALTLTKISTGLVVGGALLTGVLLAGWRKPLHWLFCSWSGLFLLAVVVLVMPEYAASGGAEAQPVNQFQPFGLLQRSPRWVMAAWLPGGLVLALALLRRWMDAPSAQPAMEDEERLAALLLAMASLPLAVGILGSDNEYWFLCVAPVLTLPLLVARLHQWPWGMLMPGGALLQRHPLLTTVLLLGLTPLLLWGAKIITLPWMKPASYQVATSRLVHALESRLARHPSPLPPLPANTLEEAGYPVLLPRLGLFRQDPWPQLRGMAGAYLLLALPRNMATTTGIYIGPEQGSFWDPQITPCWAAPFMIPALSGRPAVAGLPPEAVQCAMTGHYGYADYGRSSQNRPLSDDALCAHARQQGLDSVLRASFEPGGTVLPLRCW